jgi:hypothetical protein
VRAKKQLGVSIGEVRERAKRVAHLTLELAAAELKRKSARFGVAFGLFLVAALSLFFVPAFLLAAAAAAIALVLPLWAALLIVAGLLLTLAGLFVRVGIGLLRNARAPAPQAAAQEARAGLQTFQQGLRDIGKHKARAAAGAGASVPPEPPAPPPAAEPPSVPPGGTDGQE